MSEPTIAEAAKKAGIGEATLHRWLQNPAFKTRFCEARRRIVEHAVSGLQQASTDAVMALHRNLTCGVPAAEISAATAILDQAFRGMEVLDLAAEIAELKRQRDEMADPSV